MPLASQSTFCLHVCAYSSAAAISYKVDLCLSVVRAHKLHLCRCQQLCCSRMTYDQHVPLRPNHTSCMHTCSQSGLSIQAASHADVNSFVAATWHTIRHPPLRPKHSSCLHTCRCTQLCCSHMSVSWPWICLTAVTSAMATRQTPRRSLQSPSSLRCTFMLIDTHARLLHNHARLMKQGQPRHNSFGDGFCLL